MGQAGAKCFTCIVFHAVFTNTQGGRDSGSLRFTDEETQLQRDKQLVSGGDQTVWL